LSCRIFIQTPSKKILNWLTFVQPFTMDLWILLGLCLLLGTLFLSASYRNDLGLEQRFQPGSVLPGISLLTVWGAWMAQVQK
jgi:hypothetical protein